MQYSCQLLKANDKNIKRKQIKTKTNRYYWLNVILTTIVVIVGVVVVAVIVVVIIVAIVVF